MNILLNTLIFLTLLLPCNTISNQTSNKFDWIVGNWKGEFGGGICHQRGQNKDFPPQWINQITVKDFEGTILKASELGAKIIVPLNSESKYKMAVIQDIAGAYIGIAEEFEQV